MIDHAYLVCPGCDYENDLGYYDEPAFDLNTSCQSCGTFWIAHVAPGGPADVVGPRESFQRARYLKPSPFLTQEWNNRQPPEGFPHTVAILVDIIPTGDRYPRMVWRLDYASEPWGGKFASEVMDIHVPSPYGDETTIMWPRDWRRNGAVCIMNGFDVSQIPQDVM